MNRREPVTVTGEVKTNIRCHLRSIAEHIRRVELLVQNDDCCVDIVKQIMAVQQAIQKVNKMVLNHDLYTCANTAVRGKDPDKRERIIEEIWAVFCATGKL